MWAVGQLLIFWSLLAEASMPANMDELQAITCGNTVIHAESAYDNKMYQYSVICNDWLKKMRSLPPLNGPGCVEV